MFVDETGHEEFKSDSQIFGLGGIVGYGSEVHRANRKWRLMKESKFGGAETPIHGSGEKLTLTQLEAISEFFQTHHIGRFGYILQKPPIELPLDALSLLQGALVDLFCHQLATLTTTPRDIVICWELSERLLPKVLRAFPIRELTLDGRAIPVITLLTPKDAGSSLLEMADQVAHRAQRQFRTGDSKILPEFAAVFPSNLPPYSQYRELELASLKYGGWEIRFEKRNVDAG